MTETKTYPDGSQRVGCPPFPELSPLQEQNQAKLAVSVEIHQEAPKPKAKPGPKPKAAQD